MTIDPSGAKLKWTMTIQIQSDTCPELLSAPEVAGLLRTTVKAVYTMAERAKIPGVVRIGTRVLFRRDELRLFLGFVPKKK